MGCSKSLQGVRHGWIALQIVCLLSTCLVAMTVSGTVIAEDTASPQLSPVRPAFKDYVEIPKRYGVLKEQSVERHRLGLIPSPLDLSHLKGKTISGVRPRLGFPTHYDLRSQGKLTAVRDQGDCGSCWSFATYGSLESLLLPSETWNFSENHLKNTHGFDWGSCDGGNAYISTAYLSRWNGPIREDDDPYDPYSGDSPSGLLPQKHLQEALILPDRADDQDNDTIKQALMDDGAIYTTMYFGAFYNESTSAYYFNGSSYANHAVVIVGWDDNYSKTNFLTSPPGNGAFIIRNSWGADWGEDGYFYISYYDSKIGMENFVFKRAESTLNYYNIYDYDPYGWVNSVGYVGSDTGYFANIFTAVEEEYLKAVSFYAGSTEASYEIFIYTGVTSGPTSGVLAASQNGTLVFAGYYTLTLDSPVSLSPGQRFSVVMKLTTPGYGYPIPMEYPVADYSSSASANAGESYISSNGTNWTDLTYYHSDANACLKAFTLSASETISTPMALAGPSSGAIAASYSFTADGASSNVEHLVQYFFDWGDGNSSGWLPVGTTSASTSWSEANTYPVKVKARCATHTSVESPWSDTQSIVISEAIYSQMTLLSPMAAEIVPSGSLHTIQWGAPPQAEKFKLYYSTENGASWKAITTGYLTDRSYNWTVPVPGNNRIKCKVRVDGYTSSNVRVGVLKSSAPFTIEVVKLTSPNGGETLTSGAPVTLSWTTNETKSAVASVKLYYSLNGGSTWKRIDTVYSDAGTYPWTVPVVTSTKTNCKVRVVLRKASGATVGSDKSDSPFTIDISGP